MAEQIKVFTIKPELLSSTPRNEKEQKTLAHISVHSGGASESW